jgi:hypothetical protein
MELIMRHESDSRIYALMLSCVVACGCSSTTRPTAGPLAGGVWGSAEANLTVTNTEAAITTTCGGGATAVRPVAALDGSFDVAGSYQINGGAPPPNGPVTHPARYIGTVQGNQLTLTLHLTDIEQTLGPYRLTHGVTGNIIYCP